MTRQTAIAAISALGGKDAAAQLDGIERDAFDAWLYVLPLIEMAGARARILALRQNGASVPNNVVFYAPRLAGPQDRAVTSPNVDTLNAVAFST